MENAAKSRSHNLFNNISMKKSGHKKSRKNATRDTHPSIEIALTCSEMDDDPGCAVPYLMRWIPEKRWFLEKEAVIDDVCVDDSFRLADDKGLTIAGVIARFHLKIPDNPMRLKRYFMPVIVATDPVESIPREDGFVLTLSDGIRYYYFAEHALVFQKAVLRSFLESGVMHSSRGRRVHFRLIGQILPHTDETQLSINPSGMAFSSSNVLTFIQSDRQSVVCKTYKDMRGESGHSDKVWPPNYEAQRYETLTAANYPNVPKLLGVAEYELPGDHCVPLILMTEAITSVGQVGDIFSAALARLLETLDQFEPGQSFQQYERLAKGLRIFARQVLKTVVGMHTAFIKCGQTGFGLKPAAYDDLCDWSKTVLNHFVQAMAAIKKKSHEHAQATTLHKLCGILDRLGPAVEDQARDIETPGKPMAHAIYSLRNLDGIIMKAQVHGDLHLDQGFIKKARSPAYSGTIEEFLDTTEGGKDEHIQHQAAQIAARISWIDFEGPPAKEWVSSTHDFRECLLVDLAGLVQSLLYIANTTLYERLGLNYRNPAHHENQRKASLVLLGLLAPDKAGIDGLDEKLVAVLRLWLNDTTAAFIEGYLDEIESQGLQNILLSKWDREVARALTDYWILARAIHEFRYETYGRDWGWEAIAGARIIQLAEVDNIGGRLIKAVA